MLCMSIDSNYIVSEFTLFMGTHLDQKRLVCNKGYFVGRRSEVQPDTWALCFLLSVHNVIKYLEV